MKRVGTIMVAALAAAGLTLGFAMGDPPTKTTQPAGTNELAEKLVKHCVNIKEGDLVVISGGVRDVTLLEDIYTNVRKVGAFPVITLGSERLTRKYYDDVPGKFDSQVPQFDLKMAEVMTAVISVDYGETMGLLADVPSARLAAVGEAYVPIQDLSLKRKVKQVSLGNGLYPTKSRAALFGVSQNDLAEVFWAGVNTDYVKLQTAGEALKAVLAKGKEIHITADNGTDLRVGIEARPVFISDGVVSEADMQAGPAGCQVWLPAGEVFLAPVPGTATGTVVVDRQFYQGKEITKLTLVFDKGRLTSMTAASGLEPLKARYDAMGEGKDRFAIVDIGINPEVQLLPDSRMVCWMAAGMVTVGIGNNTWAGGDNDATFALYPFLPRATLKVDGTTYVANGKLKI